jgi:hypothetical protein
MLYPLLCYVFTKMDLTVSMFASAFLIYVFVSPVHFIAIIYYILKVFFVYLVPDMPYPWVDKCTYLNCCQAFEHSNLGSVWLIQLHYLWNFIWQKTVTSYKEFKFDNHKELFVTNCWT